MDLKHTTNATTTSVATATAAADSPDTDGETPLIKPFSTFPNGKNHHHLHQPPPPTMVAYKECLKNHAATIGSHAVDGCGEFMPSLTTTVEPTSLKCAACGCHRNFHRREPVNDGVHGYAPPHVLLSFAAGDMVATPGTPAEMKIENPSGRKRFRTKFSQDQKEKMYLFAEKVGWKMQRCDDKEVADFCNEVGIKRGIFKVWMHNNKNTFGKKDKETASPTTTATAGDITTGAATVGVSSKSIDIYNNGRVVSRESLEDVDGDGGDISNSSDQENGGGGGGGGGGGCDGGVHLHASNHGSSSSC